MKTLLKKEIIRINQKTIERHGGNFVPPQNFLNESPLDYLVDIVNAEIFGEPLYPNIWEKAALYMFNIITNHVFQDGNKRTGLGAALYFLTLNGFELTDLKQTEDLEAITVLGQSDIFIPGETTNEILQNFTLEMASGKLTLEKSQLWFKNNIIKLK